MPLLYWKVVLINGAVLAVGTLLLVLARSASRGAAVSEVVVLSSGST